MDNPTGAKLASDRDRRRDGVRDGGPGGGHAITMLADRLLVQIPQGEGERRSRAGILIPATATVSKRLVWAGVVAVGPHVRTITAGDRVLVQVPQTEGERRSRAGILIPATAQVSRRLTWGETVAVGPHVRAVKAGDKVLFNPEDRFEVEIHGEEYVILRERDIHAVAAERDGGGTGLYL